MCHMWNAGKALSIIRVINCVASDTTLSDWLQHYPSTIPSISLFIPQSSVHEGSLLPASMVITSFDYPYFRWVRLAWANIWQGGRAIRGRARGFQAERMILLSVGLALSLWMIWAIWSTPWFKKVCKVFCHGFYVDPWQDSFDVDQVSVEISLGWSAQ